MSVVEVTDHLHEVRGVARVLANTGVNIRVCLLLVLAALFLDWCRDRWCSLRLALDIGLSCGGGSGGACADGSDSCAGVFGYWLGEGVEEGWCAECIC